MASALPQFDFESRGGQLTVTMMCRHQVLAIVIMVLASFSLGFSLPFITPLQDPSLMDMVVILTLLCYNMLIMLAMLTMPPCSLCPMPNNPHYNIGGLIMLSKWRAEQFGLYTTLISIIPAYRPE